MLENETAVSQPSEQQDDDDEEKEDKGRSQTQDRTHDTDTSIPGMPILPSVPPPMMIPPGANQLFRPPGMPPHGFPPQLG